MPRLIGLCERCGLNKRLTRHHKISKSLSKLLRIPVDNSKENIELICRKCHDIEHNQRPKGKVKKKWYEEIKERSA